MVASLDDVWPIRGLPCLEHLILRDNPIRQIIEYRIKVLELFEERAAEVVDLIQTFITKF